MCCISKENLSYLSVRQTNFRQYIINYICLSDNIIINFFLSEIASMEFDFQLTNNELKILKRSSADAALELAQAREEVVALKHSCDNKYHHV